MSGPPEVQSFARRSYRDGFQFRELLLEGVGGEHMRRQYRVEFSGRRIDAEFLLTLLLQLAQKLVAGGLSAQATGSHAAALLGLLVPELRRSGRTVGPVCIAPRGRVALGDEVGALLGVRLVLVLIGERPGRTSPDSLGAYGTIGPKGGRTDADRNCVSNIRPEGMVLPEAARRIGWLIDQALVRGISGVTLKDDSDKVLLAAPAVVKALPAAG